jgi:imidazolonepropionase-like amidohydrolase
MMALPLRLAPAGALLVAGSLAAQARPVLSDLTRGFVAVEAPVVVLRGVTVLDGTGAAARPGQTVVIREGRIAAVGPAVPAPAGARVLDLAGHTVMPGLVGMHNHTFYTTAAGRRAQLSVSAPRLYLASGVTTIRTTGSISA